MARTKNAGEPMVSVRWVKTCIGHIIDSTVIDGNFTSYNEILSLMEQAKHKYAELINSTKQDRINELKRELELLENGVIM